MSGSQQSSDRPPAPALWEQQFPKAWTGIREIAHPKEGKARPVPVTAQMLEIAKLSVPLPSLTWQLVLWSVRQHPAQPFEGFIARKHNECVHQANELQFTLSYQAADVSLQAH